MKGTRILISCSICGNDRLVNTNGMLKASYEKVHPRCHKCGFNKEVSSKTWFKKGQTSWCAGTKGLVKAWNKGLKGTHFSPETEFKKGQGEGEANFNWKGDEVGYYALHTWVARKMSKTGECERCGTNHSRTHWANVSKQYKRLVEDFVELCPTCHKAYDLGRVSL